MQDRSLLDTVILAQWEDRFERGLFRYDVTACPTKARFCLPCLPISRQHDAHQVVQKHLVLSLQHY